MIKRIFIIVLTIILFHTAAHAQTNDSRLRTYVSAAETAMNNNNYAEAISHLKNAASVASDNFVPLYLLGAVYSHINDNSNAAKYYTEALNLINSNTVTQKYYECYGTADGVSYRKIMTTIYDFLSAHYKNIDRIDLAKYYNNLNIQLNISYGYKAPVQSSLELIYLCYAQEGKWNACLEYFTGIMRSIPNERAWEMCEALCHAAMGDCYANLGQEVKMINEYQQAARLGHLGAIQVLKNAGITY